MARIRSIKPDFFLHEGLAELSPLHRLFFIGLWTLADKHGRLEDRPKRIKAALLPWEDCDVEALLGELDRRGFIHRYEAGGKACIAIPGFGKHQRPHPKETDAGLPAPPCREISRLAVKRSDEFPSSPAGKEILENGGGKEISENGVPQQPPPPSPVDAVAAVSATPAPQSVLDGAKPDRRQVARVERPDKPPEEWDAHDFWAWAQDRRQATGYAPERPAHPRKLSAWWSEARALVHDVKRLKRAFYAYGEDAYWGKTAPPYPFSGFMSQWERFIPPEEDANAA